MKYNSNLHKRHSIRLKNYDYSTVGFYFITICINNRENILGEIKNSNVVLNENGKIVKNTLININNVFKNIHIHIYTIMPNHVHFILEIHEETTSTVGTIIRYFKGKTSSKIMHDSRVWQRNYYEHIVRNEKEYYMIYNYILYNPYNWFKDSLHK